VIIVEKFCNEFKNGYNCLSIATTDSPPLSVVQHCASGLTFSRSPFLVVFPDTLSTMEDLSVTARTSGAMKTTLVDVVAMEFLAGGGPLEQLVGTKDSPLFLSVPS
jgi:hypothetical protein